MSVKQAIKLGVYIAAKWTGIFAISRFLMRRRLIILCYHGFQITDEARFRPSLFMDPRRFARRLDRIADGRYTVLPLAEGIRRLKDDTLPPNALVITIDDGFSSVLHLAAPKLGQHGFPATLYVTSYYVTKGQPIFRLLIQYLFWKSKRTSFESIDRPWAPKNPVDLGDARTAHEIMWQIIDYGETHCHEDQRQEICTEVAAALGVNIETIREDRGLNLMTPEELRLLENFGVDVQLHTHRHTFPPNDPERARRELSENRSVLEKILRRRLEHFCYPSGIWSRNNLDMLGEEGIISATTCVAGMNDRATSPLALYRVLDRNDLSDIEFEAELTGFNELLRLSTGRRRRTGRMHRARD